MYIIPSILEKQRKKGRKFPRPTKNSQTQTIHETKKRTLDAQPRKLGRWLKESFMASQLSPHTQCLNEKLHKCSRTCTWRYFTLTFFDPLLSLSRDYAVVLFAVARDSSGVAEYGLGRYKSTVHDLHTRTYTYNIPFVD